MAAVCANSRPCDLTSHPHSPEGPFPLRSLRSSFQSSASPSAFLPPLAPSIPGARQPPTPIRPPAPSDGPHTERHTRSRTESFSARRPVILWPDDDEDDPTQPGSPTGLRPGFLPRSVTITAGHRPTHSLPAVPRLQQADIILQSQDSWAAKMAFLGGQRPVAEETEDGEASSAPQEEGAATSAAQGESRLAKERLRREQRQQSRNSTLPVNDPSLPRGYPGWGRRFAAGAEEEVLRSGYKRSTSLPNTLLMLRSCVGAKDDQCLPRQRSLTERCRGPALKPGEVLGREKSPHSNSTKSTAVKGVAGMFRSLAKGKREENRTDT